MFSVVALFAVTLFILAWLSHQINLRFQICFIQLTGSPDLTIVLLFLLFMPGVFVHEIAHWGMARLLGLRTGKFSVWPKRKGKYIQLGSVAVQQGGVWLDSLVGMAPLIVGSILLGLMSHRIFGAYEITNALADGQLEMAIESFFSAFQQQDVTIWIYLIFVIGNAMMPSLSDREPIKPLVLYLLIATVVYIIIGLPAGPIQALFNWIAPSLADLASAFLFIIFIDMAALTGLLVLQLLSKPRYV
ncbi:MAG: hypothetical protein AAF702_22250 [Chloroflexota bacterium]